MEDHYSAYHSILLPPPIELSSIREQWEEPLLCSSTPEGAVVKDILSGVWATSFVTWIILKILSSSKELKDVDVTEDNTSLWKH